MRRKQRPDPYHFIRHQEMRRRELEKYSANIKASSPAEDSDRLQAIINNIFFSTTFPASAPSSHESSPTTILLPMIAPVFSPLFAPQREVVRKLTLAPILAPKREGIRKSVKKDVVRRDVTKDVVRNSKPTPSLRLTLPLPKDPPSRVDTKKTGTRPSTREKKTGTRPGTREKKGQEIILQHIKQYFKSRSEEKHRFDLFADSLCPPVGTLINDSDLICRKDSTGKDTVYAGAKIVDFGDNCSQLHPKEIALCHMFKLRYADYECQKRRFFLAYSLVVGQHQRLPEKWSSRMGKSQSQQICNIDATKMSFLFQNWERWGWVDGEESDAKFASFAPQKYIDDCQAKFEKWEDSGSDIPKLMARATLAVN